MPAELMTSARWFCATSTSRAPTPRAAPASRRAMRPISSRSRCRRHSADVASRHLRHRLPDAGRHLPARLYSGHRSRPGPSRRAPLPQGRRRQPHLQRRLCARLLGARGRRRGQSGVGGRFSGQDVGPAGGRPRRDRRLERSHQGGAGLVAESTTISPPSCAKPSNGSAACTIVRCNRPIGTVGTHGASCGSSIPAPSSRTVGIPWAR